MLWVSGLDPGPGKTPRRFGVCLTASGVHDESCLFQTPPLPARCDPPCGVALYFRFILSLRDTEELLAQRGIEVSYKTIRCWTRKFGQLYAWNLRRSRFAPTGRWNLDEMIVKVDGKRMWLWRAVDDEGEVLEILLQKRRNKAAALKLLRKLLKNTAIQPETITTDRPASYRAAMRDLGLTKHHRPGGMRTNSRGENSQLPIRRCERKQRKFKSQSSAQRLPCSHTAVQNNFTSSLT